MFVESEVPKAASELPANLSYQWYLLRREEIL